MDIKVVSKSWLSEQCCIWVYSYLFEIMIAILLDKHGGWEIPREELEAIADVILPGIIKFFSTEEGRAEFEAWKKEQKQQEKTETEE